MQRLDRGRKSSEHGAVAVIVSLLMVPLIGFVAISIDVASMWSDRQQLQTGADAAALAVAQDCARNNCGTPASTASSFATANFGAGAAAVVVTPSLTPASGAVTIRTSAVNKHLFAEVLGFTSHTVGARSTASWGAPSSGPVILPLTFSWCEFKAQTGGGLPSQDVEHVIPFKDTSTGCTGPSGLAIPGGFGWMDPSGGGCKMSAVSISSTQWSSTGISVPGQCSSINFQALQNKIFLLPLFDNAGATGSNAWYHIYGFAAFKLTGYSFPSISWNGAGCNKCIKGYFTQFVDLDDAYITTTSAPDLGAMSVWLSG